MRPSDRSVSVLVRSLILRDTGTVETSRSKLWEAEDGTRSIGEDVSSQQHRAG